MMNKKLNDIGGDVIRLPDFKILASYGLVIPLYFFKDVQYLFLFKIRFINMNKNLYIFLLNAN